MRGVLQFGRLLILQNVSKKIFSLNRVLRLSEYNDYLLPINLLFASIALSLFTSFTQKQRTKCHNVTTDCCLTSLLLKYVICSIELLKWIVTFFEKSR